MNRRCVSLMVAACLLSPVVRADAPASAPEPVDFNLLVAGWGYPTIDLIDGAGAKIWSIPGSGGKVIDLWLLEDGSVLHSAAKTVRIVRRTDAGKPEVLWEWKVPKGAEIHGCQPLSDGKILLCESSRTAVTILEVERGKEEPVFRLELTDPAILGGAHNSNRSIRKTSRGTYLYGIMAGKGDGGVEVDAAGTVLHRFPGARYGVFERPGGGYIAAGGDDGTIIGYDQEAKEAWRIGRKDIPEFETMFVAQVQEFPDGRLLVANWGGHHKNRAGTPCLGLIDAAHKKLVWSLRLEPPNRVAGFYVLPVTQTEEKKE